MKKKRPVIFINEGYTTCLSIAIKQAIKSGNEVVLLSDASCKACCENWVNIDELETSEYQIFKKKYIHFSRNSYWFEFYCIKRWFVAWQYMKLNNIPEIVICDSDVLLYENMSNYDYGECEVALRLTSGENIGGTLLWEAGAEESFWTLAALEKFIYFILEVYENRIELLLKSWNYRCKYNAISHISDMALLGLWVKENDERIKIVNSTCLKGGSELLDPNVTTGTGSIEGQFLVDACLGIKKIKFINGKPHFWCIEERKWIQSLSIHMQGESKKYVLSLNKQVNARITHMIGAVIYKYFFVKYDRISRVRNLIEREEKVCVYGVGAETEKMWTFLKKFNVIFVDKRAYEKEIVFHGNKVYALNTIFDEVKNNKFIIFSKKYSMEMKDVLRQEGILAQNIYIV